MADLQVLRLCVFAVLCVSCSHFPSSTPSGWVQTPSVHQKRSSVSTNAGMGVRQTSLIGGLDRKSRTFPAVSRHLLGGCQGGSRLDPSKWGYQC